MRILITGVAGFIGSRLARWILDNVPDADIVGIDNLSSGFRENVPWGTALHGYTLGESASTFLHDEPWPRPFDYVFHCAAFAAECLSPFVRKHTYQNNAVGSAAILNAVLNECQRPKRLVFLSSIAVYGRGKPPFKETDQPIPQDPYGISKLATEMDLRVAGEQHGLDWCALRLFNVYGPYQSLWAQHRNVFGLWMRAKLEGKPLVIYGDGSQERAFTYIDDILPTIWNAAVNPKASCEVFNVGAAMPVSIAKALSETLRAIGEPPPKGTEHLLPCSSASIEYLPARHEAQATYCDVSKAQRDLMFTEATPLRDGLRRMWQWAKEAWIKYPERRNQLGPSREFVTSGRTAPSELPCHSET
jgi:UDP-glucose 4-epimerase